MLLMYKSNMKEYIHMAQDQPLIQSRLALKGATVPINHSLKFRFGVVVGFRQDQSFYIFYFMFFLTKRGKAYYKI